MHRHELCRYWLFPPIKNPSAVSHLFSLANLTLIIINYKIFIVLANECQMIEEIK